MNLEELFSSYTLRPRAETSSTSPSNASSMTPTNSAHLKMFQETVNSLLPPYRFPPIFQTHPRNFNENYYTLFIEHLSSRYIRALELSYRSNRKVFDILWSLFPDYLQCNKCHCSIARNHHKMLFWNFRDSSIICPNCINTEDLRYGLVTSFVSLLSPTFHQCIERNLRQNIKIYDSFIPRFGFNYTPDTFAVLNGLRKYNSDLYNEKHTKIRNDLFEMHLSNCCGNEKHGEIEQIRAMLLRETACFKIVDVCFGFAIKSLPNYVLKACHGCGTTV